MTQVEQEASRGREKRVEPPSGSCVRTRGKKVPWMNLAEEDRAFAACKTGSAVEGSGDGVCAGYKVRGQPTGEEGLKGKRGRG